MLFIVKMLLKGEVGWCVLNYSHGNYIADPGIVFLNFCGNPVKWGNNFEKSYLAIQLIKLSEYSTCPCEVSLANFAYLFSSVNFFQNQLFWKKNSGIPLVSNSLDPDQAQLFVELDLDPNCLQVSYQQTTLVGKKKLWTCPRISLSFGGAGRHCHEPCQIHCFIV